MVNSLALEIITGHTGIDHVTSADDASLYRSIFGAEDAVLNVGSQFEATIISNNLVRIADGDLVIQGHQARIRTNDYEELVIDNGTPGQQRRDLIVARYEKDVVSGIESINLAVIKGTPALIAVDPDITRDNITSGGTLREFPLYRVRLNGISIINVEKMFGVSETLESYKKHSLNQVKYSLFKRNRSHAIHSGNNATLGWNEQTDYNGADFCTLREDGNIVFNQKGLYQIVVSIFWEGAFTKQLYPTFKRDICFSNSEQVIAGSSFNEYNVGNLWGGIVRHDEAQSKNILAVDRTSLLIRQVSRL